MAPTKPKYREAASPQISANQLAQYLSAGASARKRIVQSARYQSTAVVARYRQAREAIIGCLCDDTRSPTKVAAERAKMAKKLEQSGISSWVKDDLESSILALDRYAEKSNKTELGKLLCQPIPGQTPPLIISGLRVKVTPDAVVRRGNGKDADVGALIAMIAKGEKSSKVRREQARTAALLVWLFAQQHLSKIGPVDRKLCLAYDVFEGEALSSSANYQTKIKNIEDACEEILAKWHTVAPPDDYDG